MGLREKRQSYHSKVALDITPGDITPGDITSGDICGPVTMGWPLFWAVHHSGLVSVMIDVVCQAGRIQPLAVSVRSDRNPATTGLTPTPPVCSVLVTTVGSYRVPSSAPFHARPSAGQCGSRLLRQHNIAL